MTNIQQNRQKSCKQHNIDIMIYTAVKIQSGFQHNNISISVVVQWQDTSMLLDSSCFFGSPCNDLQIAEKLHTQANHDRGSGVFPLILR